ncbi:unnamed protein product [Sympodiomycopsis kandeliae]
MNYSTGVQQRSPQNFDSRMTLVKSGSIYCDSDPVHNTGTEDIKRMVNAAFTDALSIYFYGCLHCAMPTFKRKGKDARRILEARKESASYHRL